MAHPLSLQQRNLPAMNRQDSVDRVQCRAKFARLSAWLDRQLDEAPRVLDQEGVRVVSVFDGIAYRVDSRQRSVHPVLWHDGVISAKQRYDVDLGSMLRTPWFLVRTERDARLRNAAYAWLRCDPRFFRLRCQVLPGALQLDPQVRKLALLARPLPKRAQLSAQLFSTVWKNREAFACAGWENPQLLPLLYLGIVEGQVEQKRDPVGELKALFRAAGLGEAAWRYVVRHGSRVFRSAWCFAAGGPTLTVAIEYLRVIEAAGLPPAPPPSVARAWFGTIGARPGFTRGWNDVPADVLRIALPEARIRAGARADPRELARFVEQFADVARWAAAEVSALDKLQRRAGWAWLARRSALWAGDLRWLEAQRTRRWPVALEDIAIGGYRALAVADSAALLEEGQRMHHCAMAYVDKCASGEVRIYSLREAAGDARVASVGLRRGKTGGWIVFDVRRRLNAPAGAQAWQAAGHLARRLEKACG